LYYYCVILNLPGRGSRTTLEPLRVIYQQLEGTYLKNPLGVFLDKTRSEVYVADTKNNLVAVYNRDGLPIFTLGYNKEFTEPNKAVVDARGRIYVLNGFPRKIMIFNYRGDYLGDLPDPKLAKETIPTALTVDKEGNIYVGDQESKQVVVYDSTYNLKQLIGQKPDGSSHFEAIQAIAIGADKMIYVADATAIPAIQVFSPEGKFVRGWGQHATGPESFSYPSGLTIANDGRVITVDSLRHVVAMFSPDGQLIGRFGGYGNQPGAVAYPTDAAVADDGRVYVVERVGSRLQIWEERLAVISKGGERTETRNPAASRMQREVTEFIKTMR
jgi:DNA-binding beta-propeller fold protein YncE